MQEFFCIKQGSKVIPCPGMSDADVRVIAHKLYRGAVLVRGRGVVQRSEVVGAVELMNWCEVVR